MSQENVELVERCVTALQRRDWAAVMEALSPDVELRLASAGVGGDVFHGHEGLRRAAREVFEVFSDAHWVPTRLVEAGDQVVATVEFRAIGKEGGVRVTETVAHVWRLNRGRIIAWHVYFDPAEALEAVGLRE